jgi:hypothetical protein
MVVVFEVVTAMTKNKTGFWAVTPCSSDIDGSFGETNGPLFGVEVCGKVSLLLLVSCFAYISTLKIEAIYSSKTSAFL